MCPVNVWQLPCTSCVRALSKWRHRCADGKLTLLEYKMAFDELANSLGNSMDAEQVATSFKAFDADGDEKVRNFLHTVVSCRVPDPPRTCVCECDARRCCADAARMQI